MDGNGCHRIVAIGCFSPRLVIPHAWGVPVGSPSLSRRGREKRLVGLEIGALVVRAAVFGRGWVTLGKAKLSTKPERGIDAVLDRVARCVRYAVDEADLGMDTVGAVGVALPEGALVDDAGHVDLEEGFRWRRVLLRPQLEARLQRPVFIGNPFGLSALAVAALEATGGDKGGLAVLMPGATVGAGLSVRGQCPDLSAYPPDRPLLRPGAGNVIRRTADPRFARFRARDFRKAIRKGTPAARRHLLASVRAAMRFGSRLVRRRVARRLVLAGGGFDENKAEALRVARQVLRSELGKMRTRGVRRIPRVPVTASALGDQVSLLGAALFAARNLPITRPRGHPER